MARSIFLLFNGGVLRVLSAVCAVCVLSVCCVCAVCGVLCIIPSRSAHHGYGVRAEGPLALWSHVWRGWRTGSSPRTGQPCKLRKPLEVPRSHSIEILNR